jgi:hypothetical protein
MRYITASSAGNPDFGKKLRSPLQDRHVGARQYLGALDGGKKTGRASADHNDLS